MTDTPPISGGFDADALKATLKELKSDDKTLLHNDAVPGTLVSVAEVIPAAPKRKLPQLPKQGMSIKFANLMLPFVENFWATRKRYPDTGTLMQEFGLSREEVLFINEQKMWLKCLDRRGIRRPNIDEDFLSHKQQAAIALISNYHDKRHKEVKLASIGCSLEEYNGWMNDKAFKDALNARSDEVLNHVGIDANIALAQLIQAGDFRATKFYFEITGKASSPEAINVKQTMQILIEAVQKHVKDPTVLQAIAAEVNQIRSIQGVQ